MTYDASMWVRITKCIPHHPDHERWLKQDLYIESFYREDSPKISFEFDDMYHFQGFGLKIPAYWNYFVDLLNNADWDRYKTDDSYGFSNYINEQSIHKLFVENGFGYEIHNGYKIQYPKTNRMDGEDNGMMRFYFNKINKDNG